MKHFSATPFAGIVFLATLILSGAFPAFSKIVSPETSATGRYRETFSLKQGVSPDGTLFITKIAVVPPVPPGMKALNHERTLRAFFAPDRGGVLTLYIESLQPHEYHTLAGGFVVSAEYPVLAWDSPTVLTFYGTSSEGQLMKYSADVQLGTLSARSVDPAFAPRESGPSVSVVP